MNQTRLQSLIETVINTLIGFGLSFIAWPVAAFMFAMPYSHSQHFGIVLFFTAISVARGYVIRRWFNARLKLTASRLAHKLNQE